MGNSSSSSNVSISSSLSVIQNSNVHHISRSVSYCCKNEVLSDEKMSHSESMVFSDPLPKKHSLVLDVKSSKNNFASNLNILREIKKGKNSKWKLLLVEKKKLPKNKYVMVSIPKSQALFSASEMQNLKSEINQCENPFLIKVRNFYEKSTVFHFLRDYYEDNLIEILNDFGSFNENLVRFYAAELLCLFECLPRSQTILNKIILNFDSRKLFLDQNGHLQLNVLSVVLKNNPSYVSYNAPEIISEQRFSGYSSISWVIGVFIYELLIGKLPFSSSEEILNKDVNFFKDFTSKTTLDLILKLLIKNPIKRLGHKNLLEIKNHDFFKNVNWDIIKRKENDSPILKLLNKNENIENSSLTNSLGEF